MSRLRDISILCNGLLDSGDHILKWHIENWSMKQEGNSDAEKPEKTSIWKEAENRGDLGEHEMIFSYLKGYPWEERSK